MRGFLSFLWLCLLVAFRPSWRLAESIASILGITIPMAIHFWRGYLTQGAQDAMNDLVWQVPTGLFASLGFMRAFMSPYLVYKEKCDEVETLRKQAAQREAPVDREKQRRGIKDTLGAMLSASVALQKKIIESEHSEAKKMANKWYGETLDYIRENVGSAEAYLFENTPGLSLRVTMNSSIDPKLARIGEIIDRHATQLSKIIQGLH